MLEIGIDYCEICGWRPPKFMTGPENRPIQFHHIKPYRHGGETALTNAIFLCPNCHKTADFLSNRSEIYHKRIALTKELKAAHENPEGWIPAYIRAALEAIEMAQK
jgi:5-methylcytosine-specific restriction endonuclease McrA